MHGLVTDIQVNVYIENMLLRLGFQNCHMLKIKYTYLYYYSAYSVIFLRKAMVQYYYL